MGAEARAGPHASARPTAYALLGPTASGKSRLAMALAARLPIEIVSLDSAQIYRGMDIGTAKPSHEERARVPHHLIDILDPVESYSAGRFRVDAIRVIEDILARARIPLLVGGTMLYYRALAAGLDALPPANVLVRREIDRQAAAQGWGALHRQLKVVDPESAHRIQPNDPQRIQRALEVWRVSGRPMSSFHGGRKSALPFALKTFALVPADRGALHRRIAERVDAMLAAGLIEEVRMLKKRWRLAAEMPSMRCVGYRQVWSYLEGEYGEAAMRERAIAATRQLAKRQLTWLRSFREVQRLEEPSAEALAERIK